MANPGVNTLIVYASRKGNTRRVAEEIGRALADRGPVELMEVADAPARLPASDILFIGAPTEGHSASPPMIEFLNRLESESIACRTVGVFDTRLAWPRVLSGSAADVITARLSAAGAHLAGEPGSFIVTMKPELKRGELGRAVKWARAISAKVEERVPVPA
ncbi:MAG: flavodoxin family protein [Candidatus Limnocylindrales bacterium]